jgi:hypothetical protein
MRKIKIYIDTSVISFYYAEDAPEKMAITRKFFDEKLKESGYEIFLSYLVLRELGNTKELDHRNKLLLFAGQLQAEILQPTAETETITEKFLEAGLIPPKVRADAIHLALAIVNRMDYILSWNFQHLVRPATRKAVREFAISEGYKIVEITTPEEVLQGGE